MLLPVLIFVLVPAAQADPTIWTGPATNFAQTAVGLGQLPVADVLVPGAVSLARNGNHWLYNTNLDPFAEPGTPTDTEWSFGDLSDYASLTYQSFDSFRDFDLSARLVTDPPSPMVCHLTNEDIYLSVTFSAWPQGGGLIAYTRSTPAAVVVAPSPTVTITNPLSGAVFSAPANVKIAASATVSSGTVTNVAFFSNSSPLGSSQAPPFGITASSLSAGPYALTAVATAAGVSATSAVVNVSVVSPIATSLAAPGATNNQFFFSYTANPGLRYDVESSSNLFNWTPLVTNVAAGSPVFFTNPVSQSSSFFRVGRLPNP